MRRFAQLAVGLTGGAVLVAGVVVGGIALHFVGRVIIAVSKP